jgi:hypothetical protein
MIEKRSESMDAGMILRKVKELCKEKEYEEAKQLIEKNKETLEDKYTVASEYIDLKQSSLVKRLKHFIEFQSKKDDQI